MPSTTDCQLNPAIPYFRSANMNGRLDFFLAALACSFCLMARVLVVWPTYCFLFFLFVAT